MGRQPIFNVARNVIGYELLFRGSQENACPDVDAEEATFGTIDNTLNVIGLKELVAGKLAFIKLTRELLLNEFYTILPAKETVLELDASVQPDGKVGLACIALKKAGYTLALGDFVLEPRLAPFLELVDIIKLNVANHPAKEVQALRQKCRRRVRLLAEKVESPEQFELAGEAGYSLFQGYFFAEPVIIERRSIPANQQNCLALLREVSQPTLDFAGVEAVIRRDPALSIRLLRYINSASFGIRNKVKSIKQAVVLLGDQMFRKWSSMVAVTSIADGGPDELTRHCLTRAEFSDRIRTEVKLPNSSFDLFLFGLVSGLEPMMHAPLEKIIEDLPLADDMRIALLGSEGPLRDLHDLFLALERVDTVRTRAKAKSLGITEQVALQAHAEAIRFADQALAA
ncbi:MAG: EAL and HDOD domain-containing protein [Phycisphaerales bacterium JB038]